MILHVASQKVKTAGCIVDIGYVQGEKEIRSISFSPLLADIDEIGDGVRFLPYRMKKPYK